MFKGYKYRLFPTPEQEQVLLQTAGNVRFVYNLFLDIKQRLYEVAGKGLSYNECSNMLTQLKKLDCYAFLKLTPANVLNKSLAALDSAYQKFFSGLTRYPKFKSKARSKSSFTFKYLDLKNQYQNEHCLWVNPDKPKEVQVKLCTLGWFNLKYHRPIPETAIIKSATVSRKADGSWYVSFLVEDADVVDSWMCPKKAAENSVGIDFGLKSFLTLSNGEEVLSPRHYHTSERKLNRLQRSFSRKAKGSKNSFKAKASIAKLHRKIADQRRDYLNKLSHKLSQNFDLITIENLNIAGMIKNHCLSKSIVTSGWHMFTCMLDYKLNNLGKYLIKANRWFASSRIIYDTGEYRPKLQLGCRWLTDCYGNQIHRDVNAAKNINYWGQHFVTTGEELDTKGYLALYI